jgi:hypothetical protein
MRILDKGSRTYSTNRITFSEIIAAFSLIRRIIARFHEVIFMGSNEALRTKTWVLGRICFVFSGTITFLAFNYFVGFYKSVGGGVLSEKEARAGTVRANVVF